MSRVEGIIHEKNVWDISYVSGMKTFIRVFNAVTCYQIIYIYKSFVSSRSVEPLIFHSSLQETVIIIM